MHADVCWKGFQFGAGADICGLLLYVHLTDCFCNHFMFTLVDVNFNSPNNQDGLFFNPLTPISD